MKHQKLFEHEQNQHAAYAVAERALRLGEDIEAIDEVEFDWRYSRDSDGTTNRSKVYPDAAIREQARKILAEWMA